MKHHLLLAPILATSVGIFLHRAVVAPQMARYMVWRNGPRVQVARRNWRGVYVPDLTRNRVERLLWVALVAFVALAMAVTYTALTQTFAVTGSGA